MNISNKGIKLNFLNKNKKLQLQTQMTQIQNQPNLQQENSANQPKNYLNELLNKNAKTSSKAQQYVAIKNVSISQQLLNGQQIISSQKSDIKIAGSNKNSGQSNQKSLKQIQSQKTMIQKKLLIIQNQLNKEENEGKKEGLKQLSDEQRLKYIHEKKKQQMEMAKRKQEQKKQEQEKQKQRKLKQEQEQKKKQEQLKQKRIQQARKKVQLIEKRKEQRIIQSKKTDQILKQKSKQKILADKIQQHFFTNQNLLLEQRKKKLAQLRQLHKPMDKNEIDQHMKKFQNSRLQRSRNKQIQKNNINSASREKHQFYYRSMFYELLQRQKKQKQIKQQQQQQSVKQFKQKSKKYAQQIKINHKPEVDQKKRQQIQKRIKSSSLVYIKNHDNKLKGIQYLQFAKQYAVKHKRQEQQPKSNKMLVKQQANKTQHTDYLAQIRRNNAGSRLKRSTTSAQDFIKTVQKKNISGRQKHDKIIAFAQNLERKARQRESMLRNGGSQKLDDQVDKLYINAIQAKIRALQV